MSQEPDPQPHISITLKSPLSMVAGRLEKTSNVDVWSPLQEISGVVKITSRVLLTIQQVQISFEGESRVHTQSVNKDDQRSTITLKSSYKFLAQSLDLENFEISNDAESRIYFYSTQFRFIISRWATPKSGNAPGQCLVLPPTFCHGPILTDDTDATTYAQPLIEYNLRVVAALTNLHTMDGMVKLYHQLEIPIRAAPEVFPPCDTNDFFNDFVTKQSHPLRPSIFSFQKYTMSLTTAEPAPILMGEDHTFESTEIVIRVSVTASINNVHTREFVMLLQSIGFNIIPGLRAKTFYSTQPFPKLPVQALLTVNGPHRLHDQVLKLEQTSRPLTSWRFVETDAYPLTGKCGIPASTSEHKVHPIKKGQSLPAEWQSEISFTITVPNDVTPTFCSATASRQYSLIILLKATGVNVDDFVLEVPIQFVSAPIHSSLTDLSEPEDCFSEVSEESIGPLRCYQNMFEMVSENDNEPPPKYMSSIL
ncbi:hypothetical protein LTR96_010963 [Exophiala xenobiotica]|nr:hypothetical protein LTR41_011061 [Exophiala xenobiotica]KAK5221502.1 hypothetical protein LTR47_010928 [Exophiala xenobiotica]KAK5246151.1 hypothetical protein LTS06_008507 [Exophiala xenobiotica]KAK5263657.1 hypothetical protein LTR96_010963 [Exophiala xenobiotica]KAK5283148.1 hypothetical protein LTR40_002225 [Exophiala xenobiotica]